MDNNNNKVNNNNDLIIRLKIGRLKIGAMTGAPIISAMTSTVIGAFVIARMTK